MSYLELSSPIATALDLGSKVSNVLELCSSAADKQINIISYCEVVLSLKSKIQTDFYGNPEEAL